MYEVVRATGRARSKEQGACGMRNAERSFLEKQICEAGFMD